MNPIYHLPIHARPGGMLAITITFLMLLPGIQPANGVQMSGWMRFKGGVGGKSSYSESYYYGGYAPYYCDRDGCIDRTGVIRFFGVTPFKAKNGGRGELLGGTFTMSKLAGRGALGRYTGDIFAVFKLDGQELVRYGRIGVRLRKRALRTPFGKFKLKTRVRDYGFRNRQLFRGRGFIKVGVWGR